MKSDQFEKRISEAKMALETYNRKYGMIANLRLMCLIFAFAVTYWVITTHKNIGQYLLMVLAYIGFGVLVWQHNKFRKHMTRLKGVIDINEKYLKRLSDEWQSFEDIGAEWIDFDHPYGMDLDIVGARSLFQKVNTAGTWHGRKQLAHALLEGYSDPLLIVERQKAIKELINQLDFCQETQRISAANKTIRDEPKSLLAYMRQNEQLGGVLKHRYLLKVLPWINAVLLVVGIALEQPILLGTSIGLMMLMSGSYILHFGHTQYGLSTMRAVENQLDQYDEIMTLISTHSFGSDYLQKLQTHLRSEETGSIVGIKKLSRICNRSHMTLQPLLAIPLNALWFWDYKCIAAVEEWRQTYGLSLEKWLEVVGEFESLVSLAVLGQIEEQITFPLIEDKEKNFDVREMGHPLIRPNGRVANDLNMQDELLIITGSNMSGKTTFLRTIGINLVLAYSGAPVIAASMTTAYYKVFTSMRIKDDLQDGVSTFYAELTRIKDMIEAAADEIQCMCLIDEIFRGTNSKDRILGAKSVLIGLKEEGAVGVITTHDLELCSMSSNEAIHNYHFTEYYENQSIKFDYTLKGGPSTSTNAQYLMEMVGIKIQN